MKMAAAEALYETEQPASFSIFTIGTLDGSRGGLQRRGPARSCRSSPPATSTARSRASTTSRPQYAGEVRARATTARTSRVTYWTFRLMIGVGLARRAASPLSAAVVDCGAAALPSNRWMLRIGDRCCRSLPLARQLVRLDLHRDGPPALGRLRGDATADGRLAQRRRTGEVLISLIVFTAALRRARGRRGRAAAQGTSRPGCRRDEPPAPTPTTPTDDAPLAFAY